MRASSFLLASSSTSDFSCDNTVASDYSITDYTALHTLILSPKSKTTSTKTPLAE